MRLACVLFNYFPTSGLARDCLHIAHCARQDGHDVAIFTQSWQGPRPANIDVHIIEAGGLSNHGRARRFYRALEKYLAREQYDLRLGFNKMPGLDVYFAADDCYVAKSVQQPFWYTLTPRYRRYAEFERAVCSPHSSTQILYLSDNQRSDFRCFHLTPDRRLHRLPPNLDPDFVPAADDHNSRRRYRAALDIDDEQYLALMVGSGFHTKGVDRAITALAALPGTLRRRTFLMIAGAGETQPYRQLAQQLGIPRQVHFFGPRDDVANLLRAADVLIHPARREAGGAVLLEALASHLPILTLSVCGHASHVARAGAGIVLPEPFRQADLDAALQKMLEDDRQSWRDQACAYSVATTLTGMPEFVVQKLSEFTSSNERSADPQKPENIYLKEPLDQQLPNDFDALLDTRGEVCREAHARRTTRFTCMQKDYFIKSHFGVGWGEIFKSWSNRRAPILGAENEWYALHRLPKLGIPVAGAAGFGRRGTSLAHRQSFVITEQVNAVSLEDVAAHWRAQSCNDSSVIRFKRQLIAEIARIARQLHDAGLNHQDFYLCHFWVEWPGFPQQSPPAQIKIYLMDLHRVQQRRRTPRRWRIKDLAGLYFSSLALRPGRKDRLRFIRHYRQQPLRAILARETALWLAVARRALRLDRQHDNIAATSSDA